MATVAGLFETRSDAEEAVRQLQSFGVDRNNIGVALQDKGEQQEFTDNSSVTQPVGAGPQASTFQIRLENDLGFDNTLRLNPVASGQVLPGPRLR